MSLRKNNEDKDVNKQNGRSDKGKTQNPFVLIFFLSTSPLLTFFFQEESFSCYFERST